MHHIGPKLDQKGKKWCFRTKNTLFSLLVRKHTLLEKMILNEVSPQLTLQ